MLANIKAMHLSIQFANNKPKQKKCNNFFNLGALRRLSSSCDDPYPEDYSSILLLSLCTILHIFWMGAYVGQSTQSLNNDSVISKKPKVTLPSIFNRNWPTCKQESLLQ